ncbi:MAG: DUF2961 domain-containing protein, partial [Planctomycetes bacterium]|nr:DUF2961 domain-containing protein [Planctomycetota bacterium]
MKTKKPRNIILFLCCILCSSLNSQDTDAKSEKTLSDKGRFFINRMRSPYLPIYGVTDTLAMLPFDEKTAMYSSADLTGDNDDGFFSTYSYLYQDTNGHFVIFDELGPGTLTRMHFAFWWISGTTFLSTPPPNFPLSIYIDDMVTPRHIVQANDIFSGRIFPLVVNVLNGQYGYNLYYPFYFQSRMKITMPFKPNFFQFDFRKGYRKTDPAKWISAINRAGQYPHDLAGSWSGATTTTIPANSRARIASNIGPAVIMGMKFTAAQISDWNSLRIEIKWDNDIQPSVNAPLGMLCGSSNPAYNLASLLFSMNGTTGYCYFPMPFNSSAQIDIVNTTSSSTTLKFDSVVIRGRYPEPFGYFCATHTSSRPTQLGRDHLVLDVPGQGTYIGTVFQAEVNLGIPNVDLYYLEGDERIYIDGAASPSYHGTGTEETFNGAWYSPLGQDG